MEPSPVEGAIVCFGETTGYQYAECKGKVLRQGVTDSLSGIVNDGNIISQPKDA